jgi:hypothetical protein
MTLRDLTADELAVVAAWVDEEVARLYPNGIRTPEDALYVCDIAMAANRRMRLTGRPDDD